MIEIFTIPMTNTDEHVFASDGIHVAIRQLLRCHKRIVLANGKARKFSRLQMKSNQEKLYRMVLEYKRRNRELKKGYRRLNIQLQTLQFSLQTGPSMQKPTQKDQSTST